MRNANRVSIAIILSVVALASVSCYSNKPEITQSIPTPTPRTLTEYEREFARMKAAGFKEIFVIRRKDEAQFDDEDRAFLRKRTRRANRRTVLKDATTVFIGTNFRLDPKDITALKERFELQVLSEPTENEPIESKIKSNENEQETKK